MNRPMKKAQAMVLQACSHISKQPEQALLDRPVLDASSLLTHPRLLLRELSVSPHAVGPGRQFVLGSDMCLKTNEWEHAVSTAKRFEFCLQTSLFQTHSCISGLSRAPWGNVFADVVWKEVLWHANGSH